MLSEIDYAFSGHKLCDAINRYTSHEIEIYTGDYHNYFKFPYKNKVTPQNRKDVQKKINESDIVHIKGDWPPKDGYLGFEISHKPVVVSVSGSFFRRKEDHGYGQFDTEEYKMAVLKTAFTPDLLYDDFKVWTPHPIDSVGQPIKFRQDNLLFLHTPSIRTNKGTDFVEDLFGYFMGIKTVITKKMAHSQVMKLKESATIFFDQFKVGFYGNAAIEAMQWGIPVAAWLRPTVKTHLDDCPVLTAGSFGDWLYIIKETIGSNMTFLSRRTKEYCDRVHSYQSVAKQWDGLYKSI